MTVRPGELLRKARKALSKQGAVRHGERHPRDVQYGADRAQVVAKVASRTRRARVVKVAQVSAR